LSESKPGKVRLLLIGSLVLAMAAAWLFTHDRLPELTTERLEAARELWANNGPTDYDLVVETEASGLVSHRYSIVIRNQSILEMSEDGRKIDTLGGSFSYAVDGLFQMLERELELATEPTRNYGTPAGYRAYLFASFDRSLGYPVSFRRVLGGTNKYAEMRIDSFQTVNQQ
jgi:hypothetical protein